MSVAVFDRLCPDYAAALPEPNISTNRAEGMHIKFGLRQKVETVQIVSRPQLKSSPSNRA